TAASRFFSRLTYADRSALALLPVGQGINFTWAHDKVKEALLRVAGMSRASSTWEYGSLSEARDIANRNLIAVRSVGDRECRSSIFASSSGGGGVITPSGGGSTPSRAPPSGGGGTTGGDGGSAPTGGASPGGAGGGAGGRGGAGRGGGGGGLSAG